MRAEDGEMPVKGRETNVNIKAIHALNRAITTLDEAMRAHAKAMHMHPSGIRCKQLFFSYLRHNASSATVSTQIQCTNHGWTWHGTAATKSSSSSSSFS